MEEFIKNETNKIIKNIPLPLPKSTKEIYNLFKSDILPENLTESIDLFYYAIYWQRSLDFELVEKYCLEALKKGNQDQDHDDHVFVLLATSYKNQNKLDQMEKYYLMASEKGNRIAQNNLALYYYEKSRYDEAIKLWTLSDLPESLFSLGFHYRYNGRNYEQMKKYYLLAIDKKNTLAMCNLANYYKSIENNYELMKKYYLMALQTDNKKDKSYLETIKEYYRSNKDDISILDFYNYMPKLLDGYLDRFLYCDLPKEYHERFCNLKLDVYTSLQVIRIKQFILRKTGIWPKHYSDIYLIHFMEIISLRHSIFPRDILLLIAGYLFI